MTEALVAFLKARLDMDAEIAAEAPCGPWLNAPTARHHATVSGRSEEAVFGQDGRRVATTGEPADRRNLVAAEHIARQDPARTLREVEAARAILDLHEEAGHRMDRAMRDGDTGAYQEARIEQRALRKVLLHEASAHEAHPDYQEEWRP